MNLISFDTFCIILFDRATNIVTYNISLSGYVIQSPEKTLKKIFFFTNYWINSNQFIKLQINYAFPMLDSVHKKRKK